MNPIFSPYVLLMIAAGVICSGIAVSVWREHRTNSETIPLVLLLLGITEWIAANLAGMLDQNLSHKMPWAQIEYIGVVSVPLMVLVYVLYHSGSHRQLTAGRLAWLALIPAATLILAWTNGSHGWIWARYVPHLENGLTISEKTYGPGFWIYWAYSYLLLLTATVITVRAMIPTVKIFRWQNILILIGILAPWIGNLLSVLRLAPLRNLDLTPLAFSITGTMLAMGMFRWQLFDIKPVAQAAVIAGMADGVMILDTLDRIVDANSAAQRILGVGIQTLVGKPMKEVFAGRLPEGEHLPAWEEKNAEIRLSSGGESRIYELSSSPFHEKQGALGGKIIFLRDLSDRKRLEAKLRDAELKHAEDLLRQSENKYGTLFKNMTVGVLYQSADGGVIDMNPAAERILGVDQGRVCSLASIRANLKTIREDGSDFPAEEHPSIVALKTGKPLRNQRMGIYLPDEKTCRWINIHAVPQFHAGDDKPYQVFVIFDDVTERKRAEDALQKSEKRLREAQEMAHLGFWIWDVKTGAVEWSEEVFTIFCLDPKEFTPQIDSILALSPWPEDHQRDQELIRRAIETRGPGSYEQKFLRPDKSIGHYYSTFQGNYDEKGDLLSIIGTVLDITERKRAEDTLLETEQRLASIYDTVGDVIFLLAVEPDGQYRFVSVNAAFGRVTGIPSEQVIGRKVSEIIPEPSLGLVLGKYRQAIETKGISRWEEDSEYPTGRLNGEVSVAPVFDAAGKCTHLVGSVHDITERKRAEESLRESEEKFKYVFDNSSVGKSITLPGGAVHPNKAFCELVGYSPDELQNKSWQDLTHPDDIASTQREIDLLISGKKEAARFAKRYLHKNGSVVWADVSTSLRRDESGKPLYFMTTLIDITDRKRAEEKLRYQASLLESANDAIVVSDAQFRLTDWNAAAEALYGWKAGEVLGRKGLEIIQTEWPASEAEEMRRMIAEQGHWRGEATQLRKDGTRIPVEVSSMVLRDADGRVSGYISLNRNISERKQAEEEIALLAKFPSENPNIVLRLARDGTLLFANNASKDLMAEWGTAIGKPVPKFWRDAAADALAHGKRSSVETESGGRWYSFLIAPIVEADYVNLYGRDETERKRAEEALRESEDKFSKAFLTSPYAITITRAEDGGFIEVNNAFTLIAGYTREEALADSSVGLKLWANEEDRGSVVADLRAGRAVKAREFQFRTKSGKNITGLFSAQIIKLNSGPSILSSINDITERKRAEEALRESETNFRTLAENAGEGVLIAAAGGVHRFANRACTKITGYSVEELLHLNAQNLAHPDEAPKIMARLQKRLDGEDVPNRYETTIRNKQGLKIPVEISSNQTIWEGRPADIVFLVDITERKRAEEALQTTLADLERSNADLEQFAYVASHDLQEPLRMVSSYTQLLGQRYKGKLDSDADEFIAYAVDGANHMQRLINDLLAYSRVGTRGKPPAPVPADLALDRALDNLKLALEETQAVVERDPLPTVTADDVQLTQVFQNLIANANKFHGDAPPRVRISAEERGEEWVFSVCDNGIGIDPQYLGRIFIIFQRLNPRGKYPGTGIGLAICKKIILRHGGRIWVESKSGKGSTFYFSLPKMEDPKHD